MRCYERRPFWKVGADTRAQVSAFRRKRVNWNVALFVPFECNKQPQMAAKGRHKGESRKSAKATGEQAGSDSIQQAAATSRHVSSSGPGGRPPSCAIARPLWPLSG